MLVKVAGWEEGFRNFYTELLTVTSERVSFYSYAWLIAALLMIVGITRGLDQMQEVSAEGPLAMVLAFLSLDGVLLLLLGAVVVVEVSRTVDGYLRDGVFNINIVRFIFTVASMGLITAGIIEIVNDIFVLNNFDSDNVKYILSGIFLALIGFLVHDSIRERIGVNPESGRSESTSSLSRLIENYRAPLLKIEKQIDDTTVILLYILSFFIPLAGFIVGAIYASKEKEHYKYVGKNCLIFSILNIVFGFIMIALFIRLRAG